MSMSQPRARLAEVFGAMGGGVHVQIGMAAYQRHHLVDPRPAAQAADKGEFRKVHGHLVEMSGMPEVIRRSVA